MQATHELRFRLFRRRGLITFHGETLRRAVGLNLHRTGGLSVSGIPHRGGTTLCWGDLRRRCIEIDAEPQDWRDTPPPDTTIKTFGPLMLRVGSYF
jgi:hypothetical protein